MELNDHSYEMEPQRPGRSQWLAMQAAYAEYRRISEALASNDQPAEDFSIWKNWEAQRRAAFEEYLEARMAYLESRFDEANQPGETPVDAPTRDLSSLRSRFGRRGLIVLALAIGLVCVTAFSAIFAQKRVHDLEASRDTLRAQLSAARSDIQRVANQVDAWRPSPSPADPIPAVGVKPASDSPSKPAAAKPQPVSTARTVRRSYRFLLARSHQYKRVGPIEVSVRSVDARQSSISLSILSASVRLNLQHVRLNQPIRISAGEHGQPMELVVDRISGDGIHGHLIEFQG
jgi:hypothetical protein